MIFVVVVVVVVVVVCVQGRCVTYHACLVFLWFLPFLYICSIIEDVARSRAGVMIFDPLDVQASSVPDVYVAVNPITDSSSAV